MLQAKHQPLVIVLLAAVIMLVAAGCSSEPAPANAQPDLMISAVQITLENSGCYDGSPMGTRVTVVNNGAGPAAMFEVQINSSSVTIEGLQSVDSTSVWVQGTLSPPNIVVDPTGMVPESDEDNNTYTDLIPIPTLPPPCATPTVTNLIFWQLFL